jgi:hypothetical protein
MDVDVLNAIKQLQQSVQALSLGKSGGDNKKKAGACWACGKMGHVKRDCPEKGKKSTKNE